METKPPIVWRIDKNVIITMLAIIVAGSIIFAFRYKSSRPCVPFAISLEKGYSYTTGEEIWFKTNAHDFQQLDWDFGDHQKDTSSTPLIWHKYQQPGNYTVTLMADNKCRQYVTLHVSAVPVRVDDAFVTKPTFEYDSVAEVGRKMSFRDTTKGASSWQWRFGETGAVDDTVKNPTYTFTKPGPVWIALTVNNKIKQSTSVKIFIKEAKQKVPLIKAGDGNVGQTNKSFNEQPVTATMNTQLGLTGTTTSNASPVIVPPPRIVPDITDEKLEEVLRRVADNQIKSDYFLTYTCDELNITVTLNGEVTTLKEVCRRLANLKSSDKIKKLKVTIMDKDEKTNCIRFLNIICKVKRDLLGIKGL